MSEKLPRYGWIADTSIQSQNEIRGIPDMRFFSALMPRETRFFDLFNRHGACVAEGGRAVASLVREYADDSMRQ